MRLLSVVCILAASVVLSTCTAGEIPAVDIGTGALTCIAMTRTADGQLVIAGRMGGILVYAVGNADGSKWSVTKLAMPELLDQTGDVYAFAEYAHVPMVAGTWRGGSAPHCYKPLWAWRGSQDGWVQETSTNWDNVWTSETFTCVMGGANQGQMKWAAHQRRLYDGTLENHLWQRDGNAVTWWSATPRTGDLPAAPVFHDASPDTAVWATTGNTLWRLCTEDPYRLGLPPKCTEVLALRAPTNNDLFLLWRNSALPSNTPYQLSHSRDGGRSWTHTATHALKTKLMDFADTRFGVLAFKLKQPGTPGYWGLWITDNAGVDWATYPLPAKFDVLAIDVPKRGEAFVLAQSYDDGRLYCLRYTTALLLGADTAVMIPTTPGGPVTATMPTVPGTVFLPSSLGPMLSWWGQGSFTACGVKPQSGRVTDARGYRFRVVYTHPQNKAPRSISVEIQDISKLWAMTRDDRYGSDYQKGAAYDAWIKPSELPSGKQLKYRFSANDGKTDAGGIPTQWDNNRFFKTQ